MLAFSPDNCFLATKNGKFLLSSVKGETFLLYVLYLELAFILNNLLFMLHMYMKPLDWKRKCSVPSCSAFSVPWKAELFTACCGASD